MDSQNNKFLGEDIYTKSFRELDVGEYIYRVCRKGDNLSETENNCQITKAVLKTKGGKLQNSLH